MKSTNFGIVFSIVALVNVGCATPTCIMSVRDAVPAFRLPSEFRACPRGALTPIDFNLLSQKKPEEGHQIAGGDVVGIVVAGILPPKIDDQAIIHPPLQSMGVYYPPYGRSYNPATGVPVDVRRDGTIKLPLVGRVNLEGKTIEEANEIIQVAYEKAQVIQKDRDRSSVTLLRPRVHRVIVLREDSQAQIPQFISKVAVPYTKIGRGEVIDLPAYENDVLHALAATGGLPGIDVFSEVWVFRRRDVEGDDPAALEQQMIDAGSAENLAKKWQTEERQILRIPLRLQPHEPLPFDPSDVVLEDGDIVYLAPREIENFYTGGQLPGGKVPLPRDQDTDILEAIALVNGVTGGPSSQAGIFRTGPGNVYPPTQCLIVRKLPNGQQVRIRVDLNRALHDVNERILIQPEDQVLLFFKPKELYANLLLNFIGVGINIVPPLNN